MPGGRVLERTALLMLVKVPIVHVRYAIGHRDAVRAVPRWPPGRGSSCEIMSTGMLLTLTWARRACKVVSWSAFHLTSRNAWMQLVNLHLGMLRRMPDHSLNA
jgi:hypothetical protein